MFLFVCWLVVGGCWLVGWLLLLLVVIVASIIIIAMDILRRFTLCGFAQTRIGVIVIVTAIAIVIAIAIMVR